MKIHEYQAKEFLEEYAIPTPKTQIATTPEEARAAAEALGGTVIVKAQVHVGGRGKAGGVKLAQSAEDAYDKAGTILGMDLKGHTVRKVLVGEAVSIEDEIYVGITVDRSEQKVVFIVSKAGGVDIEEVAATTPEKIITLCVDPAIGFKGYQARELATALFDDKALVKQAMPILNKLYTMFVEKDCSLAEINPLVVTGEGNLLAIDSKINFDDNALIKHPDYEALRDLDEEDLDELEAKKFGLSFVPLDGDIGCIVNGAGLAMATMDTIKILGGEPANFLDVGGSSNPDKIIKAFELILKNRNVKAVLINIFGGITRCDDIAKGLLATMEKAEIPVPIVNRLVGTNDKEACELLTRAGLHVYTDMEDAVAEVIRLANAAS